VAKERLLVDVLNSKDFAQAADLIAAGADVNAADKDGNTPLHVASGCGTGVARLDLVEALLAKGARVDPRNRWGDTPLLAVAAAAGGQDLMTLLLSHGADIKAADNEGSTVLHRIAGMITGAEKVDFLVGQGADVNARDAKGQTPIHRTAYHGYIETAQALLRNGADVRIRDASGRTPLELGESVSWSFSTDHPQIVELLRKASRPSCLVVVLVAALTAGAVCAGVLCLPLAR